MSTFTLGLVILGGLLLALLVGWDAWTTPRAAPRQAQAPSRPPEPRPSGTPGRDWPVRG